MSLLLVDTQAPSHFFKNIVKWGDITSNLNVKISASFFPEALHSITLNSLQVTSDAGMCMSDRILSENPHQAFRVPCSEIWEQGEQMCQRTL